MDLAATIEELTPVLTTWAIRLVLAIAVLIVGRIVAGWVRKGLKRALASADIDATLVPFLASLGYYTVLAVVVVAVLGMVGIQTASLLAVLGAAGLAIGLALQGTLSNVAAGVMLLVFRPFRAGDVVEVSGVTGSVDSVGLFSTILNTPDNVKVTVPNSGIWGGTIKNYTGHEVRRNDMVVGIGYDDDIGLAIRTIEGILRGDARVLDDPAPVVAVMEMGDSSVNLLVRPWCKVGDYWDLRWDLTRAMKEGLEEAGCSIPYPQRDVHLFQAGADASAA